MDLKIQPGTLVDWFVESGPPQGKEREERVRLVELREWG